MKFIKKKKVKAVLSLNDYPQLQIQLLEEILYERENNEFIENELLILNVSLLCRMDKKKV